MTPKQKSEHREFTDADFEALTGMHKFYFEFLVKIGTFAATGQAAIVALGGGRLSDEFQIRFVALGVAFLATVASFVFFASWIRLRELNGWVKSAREQLRVPWYPHTGTLPWMAVFFGMLNVASCVAAIVVFFNPADFAVK
ncbi:MAG: hypothetical protein AAGI30_07340 [Planctomycetota bacterium]